MHMRWTSCGLQFCVSFIIPCPRCMGFKREFCLVQRHFGFPLLLAMAVVRPRRHGPDFASSSSRPHARPPFPSLEHCGCHTVEAPLGHRVGHFCREELFITSLWTSAPSWRRVKRHASTNPPRSSFKVISKAAGGFRSRSRRTGPPHARSLRGGAQLLARR